MVIRISLQISHDKAVGGRIDLLGDKVDPGAPSTLAILNLERDMSVLSYQQIVVISYA
jgi:hypothetical protein